jgi:hypothetical protein
MAQLRMRVAYWLPKATNTHSEFVILTVFPLEELLQESGSLLRYRYIACRVTLHHLPTYLLLTPTYLLTYLLTPTYLLTYLHVVSFFSV